MSWPQFGWQFVALVVLAVPGMLYLLGGICMLTTFIVAFIVAMVKS
jgi:hypothetical protein